MKRKHEQVESRDFDVEHLEEREDSDREIDDEVENEDEANSEDEKTQTEPCASSSKSAAPVKKKKRGIIYLSTIPKHMTVSIARDMFSQYADVGRMFFQPSTKGVDGKIYYYFLY